MLLQTDDLGKTYSTSTLAWLANFYNQRRWLGWDLLCGMVDESHALWNFMIDAGMEATDILWFKDNPCPPDIVGVNYYATSERWLDENTTAYPERYAGHYYDSFHTDIEASRVLDPPTPGIGPLLKEVWQRYGIPIAVTEVHIDAPREDQLRWAVEIWDAAQAARAAGMDIRAVTIWSLLGSFDWNCLVTSCNGYYEPGPFDVRSGSPRPTAMAALMRDLAAGRKSNQPVLQGQGWWRRHGRFLGRTVTQTAKVSTTSTMSHAVTAMAEPIVQPLLITGSTGTLGAAFARICDARHIAYQLTSRTEVDIADAVSVENAIAKFKPWAIINAAGYVRVDEAESDRARCFRENALGPAVLAHACAKHQIKLITFSTDLVFDGTQNSPYLEGDLTGPLNAYGESKLSAERQVLDAYSSALVIRTSAFFGPWDRHNFLDHALRILGDGQTFGASSDVISPTYVPDLAHTCLDLLIDGECGMWHLSNNDPISWAGLAQKASNLAGIKTDSLVTMSSAQLKLPARRPQYAALSSCRGILLPGLDDALERFLNLRMQAGSDLTGQNVLFGRT
jgi:dTDP-4-dehydrorhamnose reductase